MTPTPIPRRSLVPFLVKFGLFVLVIVVGVSAVTAQSKVSRPADDALALRVRQTLADHPTLKMHKLNLLVNVIDGVAVIGGPVPDEKLGATIESAVSQVDGVARVKVSVWVLSSTQTDPLTARLEEKMNPRPAVQPAPPVALSVPTDTAPWPDPRPSGSVTTRTQPTPPAPPLNLLLPPVQSAERTSRAPHTRPPGAEPPEYTPIPATNLPTEPILEPPATPVRASPPREPERAVAEPEAWKRDPRFARLTVEVRNGTAVIGGRARNHSAAWELAEEVRSWPTVDRVVVGRVEVNR